MDLNTTSIELDEFAYEEDDVFYTELRRQVLQLTEDDEYQQESYQITNRNNVATPKHALRCRSVSVDRGGHYKWPQNYKGEEEQLATPAWILKLWTTGNGTGVFIPQIAPSRTRNRSSMYLKLNNYFSICF